MRNLRPEDWMGNPQPPKQRPPSIQHEVVNRLVNLQLDAFERRMLVYYLRISQKLSFKQIGKQINTCDSRARQLFDAAERMLRHLERHAKLKNKLP